MRKVYGTISLLIGAMLLAGCSSSPTGRSQLLMYSANDMAQLGGQSFAQLKQSTPINRNAATNRYVQCVAKAVVAQVPESYGYQSDSWEVVVFDSKDVNAFALPGGKIGVYSGLLGVAKNQDQLATVIGHELSHVLAQHSNERMSRQSLADMGMNVASVALGQTAYGSSAMAALGVGVQVGVLLPFNRGQESEADVIGLELMAKAGFDPRESVALWQNMSAASGGKNPPALLSTHPSDSSRMATLNELQPQMIPLMERAHAAGLKPKCKI